MMIKLKKAMLILLVLCLALPFTALSEGVAQTYGDYTYSIPYGTYAVIISYNGAESVVNIPETIEGMPVESISSSAFDACREQITDVTIPGTVKKFSSAFRGCVNLTNVTLLEGVTAIKNMNPYELQQAETMASCGGVDYENFTNIKKNTKINRLGNDASENMQVQMPANSWISVRRIDFGTSGAAKFTVRAKGTGKMEIRTSRPARPIAAFEFSSTEMEDHTIDLDASKFQGTKNNLFFVVTEATDVFVDAWQFTEVGAASIQDVKSDTKSGRQYFDLTGRRLTDVQQHSGIVIEQYTDKNGMKHTRKVMSDNAQ